MTFARLHFSESDNDAYKWADEHHYLTYRVFVCLLPIYYVLMNKQDQRIIFDVKGCVENLQKK